MRSRSCKQIWGTLRSEISVAFEIFGQLRDEDTEAYQEKMRMNFEKKFWRLL